MGWSNMLPEVLYLNVIARKHIVFYEDYPSLAGVCKSWHSAALQAAKGNTPPSRLPSPMLSEKMKMKSFVNCSSSQTRPSKRYDSLKYIINNACLHEDFLRLWKNADAEILSWFHLSMWLMVAANGVKSAWVGQNGILSTSTASAIVRERVDAHIFQEAKRLRFLALGWLLEEIHVTWAHLEKKQTRLRIYTKSLEDLCKQWLETASQVCLGGLKWVGLGADMGLIRVGLAEMGAKMGGFMCLNEGLKEGVALRCEADTAGNQVQEDRRVFGLSSWSVRNRFSLERVDRCVRLKAGLGVGSKRRCSPSLRGGRSRNQTGVRETNRKDPSKQVALDLVRSTGSILDHLFVGLTKGAKKMSGRKSKQWDLSSVRVAGIRRRQEENGEVTRCEHCSGGSSNRVALDVVGEEVVSPVEVRMYVHHFLCSHPVEPLGPEELARRMQVVILVSAYGPPLKEVITQETRNLSFQHKCDSVRGLATRFDKNFSVAAKVFNEAKFREVASLEGHVLLKKLIDAIDSKVVRCLKGCLVLLSKGVFGFHVYGY
ncbi:stomatal closure-related actin-binding protein 3-like protein [Tanacetum coccineum]